MIHAPAKPLPNFSFAVAGKCMNFKFRAENRGNRWQYRPYFSFPNTIYDSLGPWKVDVRGRNLRTWLHPLSYDYKSETKMQWIHFTRAMYVFHVMEIHYIYIYIYMLNATYFFIFL
jgi:hypothetical protein